MLTWTGKGAVATPVTVQIRVTRRFVGRIEAGAPEPTRSLSEAELIENVRYFTTGLVGPRTRPCTALVLAGLEGVAVPHLAAAIAAGREAGLSRITLHGSPGQLDAALLPLVDDVALTVREPAHAAAVRASVGVGRTAVVLLDAETLPRLEALAQALVDHPPDRVVFTWPLSGLTPPPAPQEVLPGLERAVALLDRAQVRCGIKGLPACQLGALRSHTWHSANRWYVDADHQTDQALLFFPDVVRWFKDDACRWCALEQRCEGVVERWWRERAVGVLRPIEPK